MLKFLASPSSCKTFQVRIAEQWSASDVKTRKSAKKPNAEWFIRERRVKLRRNPIEDGAISGFSGQKSVPEYF